MQSIQAHRASSQRRIGSFRPPPQDFLSLPTSQCSICPPSPSPRPAQGWINVWLWETCRWQMFTFIMHDFHVAVNFSEPAKSRKWFCTLCLFNEIVTLMEVRLNKMEMTVSVCRFYDLFFFIITNCFHIITLNWYLWTHVILKEFSWIPRNCLSIHICWFRLQILIHLYK